MSSTVPGRRTSPRSQRLVISMCSIDPARRWRPLRDERSRSSAAHSSCISAVSPCSPADRYAALRGRRAGSASLMGPGSTWQKRGISNAAASERDGGSHGVASFSQAIPRFRPGLSPAESPRPVAVKLVSEELGCVNPVTSVLLVRMHVQPTFRCCNTNG